MSDPFSQSMTSGVYSLENLGTRLHDAASHGRKRKVKKIVKRGVPVDFQDQQGRTALYCACLAAHEDVVSWLLKKGADPNLRTLEGATCAHAAASSGNIHVLESVIKAGADLRLHDQDGLTVYDWAHRQQDKRRQTHMLAFIEKMRAVAKTQSGRDLLLQRQSSSYYNNLTNSSSTSLGRLFHHRPSAKPATIRSISVHSLGYGKVYAGEGSQTGMISTIPLVAESSLFHDKFGHSYNNGPFMVMESMLWKQTYVTVKRLHRTPPNGGQVDLLITENKYMAQLRHPHILLLLAVCQTSNLDNLVLLYEPVLCGSLYNYLHQKLETVALWSLCDLMRQVCDAVLYLHDNQLVHCCISSHSIHLVLPTLAKLGNLEYMVQKSGRDGGYCHTYAVLNKYTDFIYNWLAPEIISGEAPVEQSDVYSLCAVIWEVLNGTLPWHGLSANQIEREVVHQRNCLPLHHDKVEPPFDIILQQGLSVFPGSRMLSVEKLREHMSRIVVDRDHLNLSQRAVMSHHGAPVEVIERSLTATQSEDQTDFSLTRLLETSISSIPCNTPTPKHSSSSHGVTRAKSSTPARRVSSIQKQEYIVGTVEPQVATLDSPKSGVVIYDSRPVSRTSSATKQKSSVQSQAPVTSSSSGSQTSRPPLPVSPLVVDMRDHRPLSSTMISPSSLETSSQSTAPTKPGRITLEVRREHLVPKQESIECCSQYPSVFDGLMADTHPKSVSYRLDTSQLSTGAHASQSTAAPGAASAASSNVTQTTTSSASARKALFQAPMPYRRKVYAVPVGSSLSKASGNASTTDTSSGSLQPMPRLTSDSQTQSSGGNTSVTVPTSESPLVSAKFSSPQNAAVSLAPPATAHQPPSSASQPQGVKSPGEDNPFHRALLSAEDETVIHDLATLKQPRLCSRVATITNQLTKKAQQHKHDYRGSLSKQTVFGALSQPDNNPIAPVRRKSTEPTTLKRQQSSQLGLPKRRGSRTQSSVFNRIQAELEASFSPLPGSYSVLASTSDTSHVHPSRLNHSDSVIRSSTSDTSHMPPSQVVHSDPVHSDPVIMNFKPASHRQALDGTPADSSLNNSFNSTRQSLTEDDVDAGCHTTIGVMEYPVLARLSKSLDRGCSLTSALENTLGQAAAQGVTPTKFRSDSHLCAGVVSGQEELEGDMDTTISLQSQGSVKDLIQAFQQQAEQQSVGHEETSAPSTDVGSLSDRETAGRQQRDRPCKDAAESSKTKSAREVVDPNANNNAMQMSDTDSCRTIDNSSVTSSVQVRPQNDLQEVAAAICASLDNRLNQEMAEDYYFDDEISPNLVREKHMRLQTTMALDGSPAMTSGLTPLHASLSTESYTPLFPSEDGSGDSHRLITEESSMEDIPEHGLIPANKDALTLTSVSPDTLKSDSQHSDISVSKDASNTLLIRKIVDGDTDVGTSSSVRVESLQHGDQGLHTVTHRHVQLDSGKVHTTYRKTHAAEKVVTRVITREKEGFDV